MSEPKRWSDPSSDVDPVLRSVLRYGSELQPDSRQLQRLLGATDSVRRATSRRVGPQRRRRIAGVLVAGLAAAFGGVAWASYAGRLFTAPARPVPTVPSAAASSAGASPRVAPPVEAPPSSPSAAASAPRPQASLPALPAPASPSAAVPGGAEQDAALLQQARAVVGSNPARALMLTRDHEVRFEGSPLVEERQALRVEALFRLGRREEAQRAFGAFEASYPRSPYRRRLQALGQ
jgi:hypothetical protein